MEYVSTNNAPGAIGPYSQAVKTGKHNKAFFFHIIGCDLATAV